MGGTVIKSQVVSSGMFVAPGTKRTRRIRKFSPPKAIVTISIETSTVTMIDAMAKHWGMWSRSQAAERLIKTGFFEEKARAEEREVQIAIEAKKEVAAVQQTVEMAEPHP